MGGQDTVIVGQQLDAVQRDFLIDVIDVAQEGNSLRARNGDLLRGHAGWNA